MINFKFNIQKTTDTVCLILSLNNNFINYMKLLKLLYLIDREALNRWERPVSGDRFCSMDRGPVLSKVYDLIKDLDRFSTIFVKRGKEYWFDHIGKKTRYDVCLIKNSDYLTLSKNEIKLIQEINAKFKDFSEWEMVKYCHKNIDEWEDPKGSSAPIMVENIFKVLHRTTEEIEEIKDEIENINYVDSVLQC